MKIDFVITLVLSLSFVPMTVAQNSFNEPAVVSFYQLSHKPDKQARRLFDKGSSSLRKHDFETGLQLLKKAVEIDPGYWAAENNIGYTCLKLAQIGCAEQAFKRAVEIDPQNPIGYTNLSVAAVNRNDYRLAEKFARQALQINPVQVEAKGLLGLAEAAQGNWTPEAHKLLEEGRQFIPGSERLLRKWPRPGADAPMLVVVQGQTR